MKKLYDKVCKIFSMKRISYLSVIGFGIMLLPVFYLSFVNRATGDDYGYGTYTRAAWVATHSVAEVIKASWRTIVQYYDSWQGTWFSIFLFTLQPEVFHQDAYVITAFLTVFLWIGSTGYLLKYVLKERLKFDRNSTVLLFVLFMMINIEWIPSTKSSIFWYNGAAHYMIPYAMGMITIVWLLKYAEQYKMRYLAGSMVFMALLGGASYQTALFVLIAACYVGAYAYFNQKDKKIFYLLILIMLEMAGLLISAAAPGNKERGGEEFGFSLLRAVRTIAASFQQSFRQPLQYFREVPMLFLILGVIFLILLEAFLKNENSKRIRFPFIQGVLLWCLFSAMYAPELYAGVEVSSGVYNIYYQVFLLSACGILLLAAQSIAQRMKKAGKRTGISEGSIGAGFYQKAVFPGFLIALALCIPCRADIKQSTTYECLEYIVSGQAADYKEQMQLQTRLLLAEDTGEVVLPMINDVQGPLMHMPVTAQSDAWSNRVTAAFYGKESVVGMPREEWEDPIGEGGL